MPKPMPLKERYEKLTSGKKRQVREKYFSLFRKQSAFYHKLRGELPLIGSEQIFFAENL